MFNPREVKAALDFLQRLEPIGVSLADSCLGRSRGALPPTTAGLQVAQAFKTFLESSPRAPAVLQALSAGQARLEEKLAVQHLSPQPPDLGMLITAAAAVLGAKDAAAMARLAECAFAIHLIDDHIDDGAGAGIRSVDGALRTLLISHRHTMQTLCGKWPVYGALIDALAAEAPCPEGFYHALQRVVYGAVVSGCPAEMQDKLVAEYCRSAAQHLSGPAEQVVRRLAPFTYYFTNKCALEMFPLEGSEHDWNLNELRTLAFTPILFLSNLPAEVARNEASFAAPLPGPDELTTLVDAAAENLRHYPHNSRLFLDQLEFMSRVFDPILPQALRRAYQRLNTAVRDVVACVDEEGRITGAIRKLDAHVKALRHLAFSVFVMTSSGLMLIHQRAESKYHSGGLWTNACCGHPLPGEEPDEGAARRLFEEMGLRCKLQKLFEFSYRAQVGDLVENELDHVFLAVTDDVPHPDPAEVAACKALTLEEISASLKTDGDRFTPWFKLAFPRVCEMLRRQQVSFS